MKICRVSIILLPALVLAGCGQGTNQIPEASQASPSAEVSPRSTIQPDAPTREIATPDRFNYSPTGLPERLPEITPVTSVAGEVPDELLDAIRADLGERIGAAADRIFVIQEQAAIWNDGSLGCPQPGVFYTQALVNGYWVILEVDGKKYDYRASESGYFFICENEVPPVPPPGTPSS